ncbi:hypothetical protein ACFQVA_24370 [Actinomadura keratinilytica]
MSDLRDVPERDGVQAAASPLPSRRGLLRLGGGLVAASAFGLSLGAGSAAAAVPASKRFSLTEPSHDLFRHVKLHDARVQQSFTFDIVNRRLFVAQLKSGSPDDSGDLCITQLDFSGNKLGHMYLLGFGHGVSIGAQPVGADTYLWTEVDVNSNARGTRLARFKWNNGATLSRTSAALAKHQPIPGATEMTCAIDPVNNRMAIRYLTASGRRYGVYNVADIAAASTTSRSPTSRTPRASARSRGTRCTAATSTSSPATRTARTTRTQATPTSPASTSTPAPWSSGPSPAQLHADLPRARGHGHLPDGRRRGPPLPRLRLGRGRRPPQQPVLQERPDLDPLA